jgi:pilin isopeptide linkage protein
MPGDSDNDRHVFVLDGNNAEKMISLQFQHGGVYRYHLVQTSKDKENYTYDRSSYIIAVYIKNGENGKLVPQVIAEKNDGKKYGELMFYNSYNKRNI